MQFDEFKAQVIGMFPSPAWSQYDAWKFFPSPEGASMHGAEHQNGLCILRGFDDFAIKWSVAPLEISCDSLDVAVRYAWAIGGWRIRRRIKSAIGNPKPFRQCRACGGGKAIGRTMHECVTCDSAGYVKSEP